MSLEGCMGLASETGGGMGLASEPGGVHGAG